MIDYNPKLKMKEIHFYDLSICIKRFLAERNLTYSQVRKQFKNKGLSDMRYRWDLLHASKYPTKHLYEYLTDSHIDSALKLITNTR